MSTAQELTKDKMTKTERNEIKVLINNKFDVLEEQLSQRKREAEALVEKEVRELNKEKLAEAKKKTKAILDRVAKINKDWAALVEEMNEAGIESDMDNKIFAFYTAKWADKEVHWAPANLYNDTQEVMKKLREQHGLASLNLKQQKLGLREELIMPTLTSTDAIEFMNKIPTVDEYLPLPTTNKVKELLSA